MGLTDVGWFVKEGIMVELGESLQHSGSDPRLLRRCLVTDRRVATICSPITNPSVSEGFAGGISAPDSSVVFFREPRSLKEAPSHQSSVKENP